MKKLVFATVMALASLSLAYAPVLRAQESGQIEIKDPAEFNAYQQAITQSNPAAKASALESFLQTYPQSVVKKAVLDELINTYQAMGDSNKTLGATSRLLQVDPNNMKAIYLSVYIKRTQCQKTNDPQVCDDAAALAQKGLAASKGAGVSDDEWKKLTGATYPAFYSAIALDNLVSKKDSKAAQENYIKELMLYPLAQTTSGIALGDTLQLAEAYAKPDARDMVQAIWFYARAWNFAPPAYKAQIEPKLEYWYKRFHGGLDGLDAVKAAAAQTLFKPDTFTIKPAPTPPEIVHNVLATTPDLTKLNLEDKEFILANGNAADAQKLWAVLQGQATPVPGIVIDAPADVLIISATTTASAKSKDYVVKLTTPAACGTVPPAPSELKVKDVQAYILANGVKADTDAMGDALTESAHIRKLSVEPGVSVIKVAVTQDAKDNKVADFIVNMKEPVSCKDAPAVGFEYKLQPDAELDATYDTYTAVPAEGTKAAKAQIVLKGGFIQAEKKAAPPARRKPAAGRRR